MGRRFNRQARKTGISVQAQGLRPADFPIGSLQSRAAARALLLQHQKRAKLILSIEGKPLSLETSTCTRQIGLDGSLVEFVMLDGDDTDLTDAQLEAFIQQHPVVDR
jgi:hypothetical protein